MGSALGDPPVVEDEDAVGVADGAQAVRDEEARARAHDALERALHDRLALGVERARRLVEDQDPRVLQQRARDGQALPLAAGEVDAALAEPRAVAVGQRAG